MNPESPIDRARSLRRIRTPRPKPVGRRGRCLEDLLVGLRTYFPVRYYQEFTDSRAEMVHAIRSAISFGGDQGVAAPRGDGKTRVAAGVALLETLANRVDCIILIGKNADGSKSELDGLIKEEIEGNDLLCEDFPEVCIPIRAMGGWASGAKKKRWNGKRLKVIWTADGIRLPQVDRPGSGATGQCILARGWEGRVRGSSLGSKRPSVAIIDDIEDRESAESETQIRDREEVIEKDVGGLSGPEKKCSRVMLCTIINEDTVAAKYTDRKRKPGWRGRRYARLTKWPDRRDLWDQFVQMFRDRDSETDPYGRAAQRFYEANLEAMQAGAEVANADRYDHTIGEDGEMLEPDALFACFKIIAEDGLDAFLCECQNDPPKRSQDLDDELTAKRVASQLSALERLVVPDWTDHVTAFVDIGKRMLHWCVMAHRMDGAAVIIDYGIWHVTLAETQGTDGAILDAMRDLRDELTTREFRTETGEPVSIERCLWDAGNWNTAVYQLILESDSVVHRAAMGLAKYRARKENTKTERLGYHCWQSRQGPGLWVVNHHTAYWKRRAQEGLSMTLRDDDGRQNPASVAIFGDSPDEHLDNAQGRFAQHIVNEQERVPPGKPGVERPKKWIVTGPNHFLDCAAGCLLGASLLGVKVESRRLDDVEDSKPPPARTPSAPEPASPSRSRPTLPPFQPTRPKSQQRPGGFVRGFKQRH